MKLKRPKKCTIFEQQDFFFYVALYRQTLCLFSSDSSGGACSYFCDVPHGSRRSHRDAPGEKSHAAGCGKFTVESWGGQAVVLGKMEEDGVFQFCRFQ